MTDNPDPQLAELADQVTALLADHVGADAQLLAIWRDAPAFPALDCPNLRVVYQLPAARTSGRNWRDSFETLVELGGAEAHVLGHEVSKFRRLIDAPHALTVLMCREDPAWGLEHVRADVARARRMDDSEFERWRGLAGRYRVAASRP